MKLKTWLSSKFKSVEAIDICFVAGLVLAGAGIMRLSMPVGIASVGVLLLLTARPLIRWIR